jgi:hypothetical protein
MTSLSISNASKSLTPTVLSSSTKAATKSDTTVKVDLNKLLSYQTEVNKSFATQQQGMMGIVNSALELVGMAFQGLLSLLTGGNFGANQNVAATNSAPSNLAPSATPSQKSNSSGFDFSSLLNKAYDWVGKKINENLPDIWGAIKGAGSSVLSYFTGGTLGKIASSVGGFFKKLF